MSEKAVRLFLKEQGLEDPVFILGERGATVEEAAKTIGVASEFIAKTLAFRLKETVILIVMRGDARIDNKKYKQYFQTKARMLDHGEIETITGHPIGGLCPFGLKNKLTVYMDKTIEGYPYIYPAAGSPYAAMKISPQQMQELTGAKWIDVCQKSSV